MRDVAGKIIRERDEAREALVAEKDRNRELTRQVEQLQARVAELEQQLSRPSLRCRITGTSECNIAKGERICGDPRESFSMNTAPPSSAPTAPGRADTGRDET